MALFQERGQPWAGRGAQEQLLGPRPPPPPQARPSGKLSRRGGEKAHFLNMRAKKGKVQAASTCGPKHPRGPQPGPQRLQGARGGTLLAPRGPALPALLTLSPPCPAEPAPASPPTQAGRDRAQETAGCGGHAGVSRQQELRLPGPRAKDQAFPRGRSHASMQGRRSQPRTRHESLLWVPWAAQTHPAHRLPPPACRQERRGQGGEHGGRGAPADPQKWTPREDREAERGRGPGRGLREAQQGARPWGKRGSRGAGQSRQEQLPGVSRAASAPWADTQPPAGGSEVPAHRQPLPEPAQAPPRWCLKVSQLDVGRPLQAMRNPPRESRPCLREHGRKASHRAGGGRRAPSRSRSLQPSWGSLRGTQEAVLEGSDVA